MRKGYVVLLIVMAVTMLAETAFGVVYLRFPNARHFVFHPNKILSGCSVAVWWLDGGIGAETLDEDGDDCVGFGKYFVASSSTLIQYSDDGTDWFHIDTVWDPWDPWDEMSSRNTTYPNGASTERIDLNGRQMALVIWFRPNDFLFNTIAAVVINKEDHLIEDIYYMGESGQIYIWSWGVGEWLPGNIKEY